MTEAIALTASAVLAVLVMFGVPIMWVVMITNSDWNKKRLVRARKYRAIHGTPWWIIETDAAARQRRWLGKERERAGE